MTGTPIDLATERARRERTAAERGAAFVPPGPAGETLEAMEARVRKHLTRGAVAYAEATGGPVDVAVAIVEREVGRFMRRVRGRTGDYMRRCLSKHG
jgi:hypothetical protein